MSTSRSLLATGTAALLGLTLAAPAAAQQQGVTTERISGDTRFDTAVGIAETQYDTTDHAVIARADAFPDAMTAAPLARTLGAPILLTNTDSLPDETRQALEDLGVEKVTVLGGTTAVSDDVVETLRDDVGVEVDRVEGETRYATAAAVTRAVQGDDNPANFPGDTRAAFIAFGENFPDALATGPLAASRDTGIPVLLTRNETLPDETREAIEDLDIETVIITGGPVAVSEDVEQELRDLGLNVERVAGDTRQETATELADFGREFLDLDLEQVELTRGDLFVDALATGPYAGAELNPIVLTNTPDDLSDATSTWLAEQCEGISTIEAIGGDQAVTPAVLNDAARAADCDTTTEDGTQDLSITPMERIERVPGESQQFEMFQVDGEKPAADFTTDVTMFPCDAIDEPTDGTFVFDDADDDGQADGITKSNTDAASFTELNGDSVDDVYFRDVGLNDDGTITATLTADGEDCADLVMYVDENDSSSLDLDADGQPVEPWGFAEIAWVSPNA